MEAAAKVIKIFRAKNGTVPFIEWFSRLRDERSKQKIRARLARVRTGNLGRTNTVGEGVQELKIDYGAGYRLYFAHLGSELIILLCGGEKRTQDEDIKEAKAYWKEYRTQRSHADY